MYNNWYILFCFQVDDELADIDLSDPDLNKAATKIQASFRGHKVRKEVISKDGVNREEMAVGQWAVAQHFTSLHRRDAWTYGIHVTQKHCSQMLTSWYTNCYSYYFPLYTLK